MNRRHLLAGAAALPVAGLVVPTAAADADPAVIAYRVWRDAGRAYGALLYLLDDWDDDDPEVLAMQDAERKARKALVETVATTPVGIACQVRLAFDLFHDQSSPDAEPDRPERYGLNGWANDIEGKLPRNMLAAASSWPEKKAPGSSGRGQAAFSTEGRAKRIAPRSIRRGRPEGKGPAPRSQCSKQSACQSVSLHLELTQLPPTSTVGGFRTLKRWYAVRLPEIQTAGLTRSTFQNLSGQG